MEDKEKVDSPEKLQSWIDNTETILADMKAKNEELVSGIQERDEKIKSLEEKSTNFEKENENLKKEVKDIGDLVTVNKGNWKETDQTRKWDYELGKWWARWMLGYAKYAPRPLSKASQMSVERLARKGYKPLVERVKVDPDEVDNPNYQKTDLGTPLTGMKIASLASNGRMNSSQIQGNPDRAILSQAMYNGRCNDSTGATLYN